jgi:4-amino-4-deoxy-L-arabinose transferase-like glycosyltransferase
MLRLTHPKILLKVNLKTLPNLTLGLILLAYVMNVSMVLSRGQSWGDDFAAYIMQAKSIVTGTENSYFEQNSFTIQNSSSVIGPVAYPWGYPLFLSMFYVVFGLNLLALKIPNILFFILFLIVFYRLLKWRLPPWESILLVSILAFNPSLLSFQNNILSDIPFLFLSTLSVILIDRFVCKNKNIPGSPFNNLILGITIFLATFVRITGIILLVTTNLFHTIFCFCLSLDCICLDTTEGGIFLLFVFFISIICLPAKSQI